MTVRHSSIVGWSLGLVLVLVCAAVPAQGRPSLAGVNAKLDAILADLEQIKGALGLLGPVRILREQFGADATSYDFDALPCAGGLPALPGVSLSSPNGFNGLAGPAPPVPAGCQSWGDVSSPGRFSVFFNGLTITPDTQVTRVGFVFGGNVGAAVEVRLMRGGSVTATFDISTAGGPPDGVDNWAFYGFQDVGGIDAIEISETGGPVVGFYDLVVE